MSWLIVAALLPATRAAFCGSSTVPFSLEVLPGGGTVLGCARPACFGWDPATGNHASDDSSFVDHPSYRDGFVRSQDPLQRAPFNPQMPQTASCFPAISCGQGQWVGGFLAGQDGAAPSLVCCSHMALLSAADRGIAPLQQSQYAAGGEIQENGQTYFDYLRNIQAVRGADGQLTYNVEMGRMSCPEPQPLLPVAVPVQQVYQPILPPQPAPSYGPASYGYGAGFAPMAYLCFAADSMVTTIDDKEKRMDELSTSDWIMSPSKNYSITGPAEIKSWLHRMPEVEADFLVIRIAGENEIKLTPRHFIMRADCGHPELVETVPAEEIQLGDCLLEMDRDRLYPAPVISIRTTRQQGIYAPLTDSGKLMVNNIVASCYSEVDNQGLVEKAHPHVIHCRTGDELHCSLDDLKFEFLLDFVNLILPSNRYWGV